MEKRWALLLLQFLAPVFLICWITGCPTKEKRPPVILKTASGVETIEFQVNESILMDVIGLKPRTEHQIKIMREDNKRIVELNLTSDQHGRIPETVIWYDIAELPYLQPAKKPVVHVDVSEHDICDFEYLGKSYMLLIMHDNKAIYEKKFRVIVDKVRPTLYASDSRGIHKPGFLIGKEDIYVVGKNFPTDSMVRVWAVEAKEDWKDGDSLKDITKQHKGNVPPVFEITFGKNGFKKLLWPKTLGAVGSYDIVAEIITYPYGKYSSSSKVKVERIISYSTLSGFVIQRPAGEAEPLEMDLAGSRQSPFTFRDTFLANENVYVGVDPVTQPSYIGETADVYIVNDKTEAQWNQPFNLSSEDVTGTNTSITIQSVCGNCWKTLAWPAPLIVGDYDVVLDFNRNNQYDPGIDLIDSLNPVGFSVSEIRVDKISFNYTGSNAVTIFDDMETVNFTAPEYSETALEKRKPAAWKMAGSYSIKVDFVAVSNFSSVQIWAEGGVGGLNPANVTFSSNKATATFSVINVPSSVGKHSFDWNWKYNASGGTQKMGTTGKHIVYTVLDNPVAPSPSISANPALTVLDYSCSWASGATTKENVCVFMLNNGFAPHYNWVGNCHWLASTFDRLVSAQGINVVQHRWAKSNNYPLDIGDIVTQKTKDIDPVGSYAGLGHQFWNFHQWAEAEGKQRDPSVAESFVGTWVGYEDDVYVEYNKVDSISPFSTAWVANQPGTDSGGVYLSPAPFLPWKDPDY